MSSSASRIDAFSKDKERFDVFLRNTDQKQVQLQATLTGLHRFSPRLWRTIVAPNQAFRMLAVGAGNGGIEIPLIKAFIKARGTKDRITLFCEDVSSIMENQFWRHAETTNLQDIIGDYQVIPFEDAAYSPPKADFVISSHVWYYITGWKGTSREKNTLVKFYSAIAKDGIGLITLYSEQSERYVLLKRLHDYTGKGEPELPGERVAAELHNLNIKCQTEIAEAHTKISSCFADGVFAPTYEGKALLSFVLRTDWDDIPGPAKEAVGKKMAEIVLQNEKAEMVFRDLYIWIFR